MRRGEINKYMNEYGSNGNQRKCVFDYIALIPAYEE